MQNMNETLLALVLVAALAFFSTLIFKKPSQKNLPPGPKPWPIIGNVMSILGPSPHRSLHSLSQKYGGIMLIKLGKFPVVVASSPQMAKQFLKVHDTNFASRPSLAAGKYTAYNYSDMTWAPYGPYWRQARKIFISEVFSAKRLEFFEPVRVEESRSFLSRLRSLSGKPVVLREQLSRYTLSSIGRMVFSNKYFSETGEDDRNKSIFKLEELQGMLDEWFLLNGVINIGDWMPWLSFLDLQGYVKRMKDLCKKLDRFNEFVLDDHQARRAAQEDFVPKDLVDMLLLLAEDPNLEVKLTRDNIKALLQDLLAGAIDTSASSIEWAIHEVLRHPPIAEKAKEELKRVIGNERWVEESDLSQLPYINAIIMESFRLHPLSALPPPHCAIEDCNVAGYDIPKGTPVIINTWSLGRDPNSWDAPKQFLPERFLGEEDIDVTGSNFALLPFGSGRRRCPGFKLGLEIPFGSGRRRCPGFKLGLEIVGTTLANLLHGFEMGLVDGMRPQDICVEEVYGLTTHPKVSLKLILEPTLSPHLYQVRTTYE